jgi:4'-phosphopantetheinyl transferase EntD
MLELAIDENIFSPPMPGMDFQYFIIRATQEEQKSYDYGVPEANVSTLRRMKRRAEELQQREQAAAMTQAAGMITPTVSPQQPQAGTQPNVIQQDTPG